MARHAITVRDELGDAEGTIVWDDEAGRVAGAHFEVRQIRKILAKPKPVRVGNPGWTWDLRDPAHDRLEFLTLLTVINVAPLRGSLDLPPALEGFELPPGEPGEMLLAGDGTPL